LPNSLNGPKGIKTAGEYLNWGENGWI